MCPDTALFPPNIEKSPVWIMHKLLLALLPLALAPSAALAQKEIPKAPGFNQCPAGYVNTPHHLRVSDLLRGDSDQW